MNQTHPYQNRIHLFHYLDGKLWTFKNITDASLYINWIQSVGEVGEHFIQATPIVDYIKHNCYDLILRDDYSEIVTIGQLYGEYRRTHPKKRITYHWFRGFKRTFGRYYRHPHSTNERRQAYNNYDSYEDYGIIVQPRGQRNINNLPNAWDDTVRIVQRSWKNTRKHQWY
jgi:hypothetical protein